MGTQFGQNCLCLLVGRAKAHIPGVLIMFPCPLPWEEEPKDRLLLQNLMAIRITPDSCPIHTRITRLHTVPHPSRILVVLVGPVEGQESKGLCLWWGLGSGSLVEECICLACPATNRCCMPTALRRRSGPTAGSPTNPTIQLQSCESSANHTLESYPRIIPRIIPSNHTTYSNFPARLRNKNTHPNAVSTRRRPRGREYVVPR